MQSIHSQKRAPRWELPPLARYVGIGLIVVACAAAFTYWINRGSHLTVEGAVLKVRTISTDDNSSIAIADFRIKNVSTVPLFVSEVKLVLTKSDGSEVEGATSSEMDLDRVLSYYQMVGPRFNPVLKPRDKLQPGVQLDRTIAASFNVPESALTSRRNLTIRILDADGATLQISERAGK
jgi:hypothetical protein